MLQNLDKKISRLKSISSLGFNIIYLTKVRKASKAEIGKYTREQFTLMGPTFIKIGQFMSTRSDIFGSDFTEELKILQDKNEPFDYNVKSLPVSVEEKPIATASIGQVYVGKVSDNNIVVKVKRPNIDENIKIDFEVFIACLSIASLIANHRETMEFNILINEYYKILQEEVDFEKELKNLRHFKVIFKDKKYVKVPLTYNELSNANYITMEYVPSIRIDDLAEIERLGFDRKKIANKLVELFLDQIILYGIIHIDPHPGNVGITKKGKIVFYDYGMVQSLDIDFKKDLKTILYAVSDRNIDYITDLLIKSGIIIIEADKVPYLKNFVMSFLKYLDNLDIADFKKNYIDKVDRTEMPFVISSKFLLILRAFSILEGVCKTLDRDFSYKDIIEKYIDDNIIDVNYLERRAMLDIDNMRTIPDKITKNEIQMEIMEKSMQKSIVNKKQTNLKLGITVMILLLFDITDVVGFKIVLSCLMGSVLLKM